MDKQGRVKDTLGNLTLILRNDPRLKDIAYNIHRSGIDIRRDAEGRTTLPWTPIKPGWNESDLGSLLHLSRSRVHALHAGKLKKASCWPSPQSAATIPSATTSNRCPHGTACPEWTRCSWTIWARRIRPYTRAVARKMLVAAIARVYQPGIKFDSVVVLNGPAGHGQEFVLCQGWVGSGSATA